MLFDLAGQGRIRPSPSDGPVPARSLEEVNPSSSYEAGRAFGDFQSMLSDLPEGALGETIPNFHNMEFRLQQFHEAVQANAAGRADEVKDLIDEIEKRAKEMCVQEELYREGKLKNVRIIAIRKSTISCSTKMGRCYV